MGKKNRDIFDRMRAGESIPFDDPEYHKIFEAVSRTIEDEVLIGPKVNVIS